MIEKEQLLEAQKEQLKEYEIQRELTQTKERKLEQRIAALEQTEKGKNRKSQLRQFVLIKIVVPILGFLIGILVVENFNLFHKMSVYQRSAIYLVIIMIISELIYRSASRNSIVQATRHFVILRKSYRWRLSILLALTIILFTEFAILSFLGVIIVGIGVNLLTDWLKAPHE